MQNKNATLGESLFLFATLFCFIILNVMVQAAPTLKLNFYKNNGYSLGNDMNGLWTINTEVSSDVVRVEFYLDDLLQLNDTNAPFSWPFDTNNYTIALHSIKVVAYNSAGEQAIEERQPNFVGFPITYVVGIITLIVVGTVGSFIFAFYRARKQEAKELKEKTHRQ